MSERVRDIKTLTVPINLEYVELVERLISKHGATLAEGENGNFVITFPDGTVEREHPAAAFSQVCSIIFPDHFTLRTVSTRRAVTLCVPE